MNKPPQVFYIVGLRVSWGKTQKLNHYANRSMLIIDGRNSCQLTAVSLIFNKRS